MIESLTEVGDIVAEAQAALADAWKPPFTGEIYDWAGRIDLQKGYAIKGQFDVSRSIYLKRPFQSLRNREKRGVIIQKAVRTGGSLVPDLWVPNLICNDPGELLWLLQDDDIAKKYAETRLMPLLESVPEIRAIFDGLTNRHDKQKTTLLLPNMSMIIGGLNLGNVQTLGKRYVIVDECWMSKCSGLLRQAIARTEDYPYTSKYLLIGQSGVVKDDFDMEWRKCCQFDYGWHCPKCGKIQTYELNKQRSDGTWAGVRWETNSETRPGGKLVNGKWEGGRWNYARMAETCRFSCYYCDHEVSDTPENRRRLNDGGDYIELNPGEGMPTVDGFHWNALANIDIKLGHIATLYLHAKEQKRLGNTIPMQEFTQKHLAWPWDPDNEGTSEVIRLTSGEVDEEQAKAGKAFDGELRRTLQVDCQQDFTEFWWNVTAWGAGEVRELARGCAQTWGDIAKVQAEWKVKDHFVFVDLGYEQTAVIRECVKHGHEEIIRGKRQWLCWTGLKGYDRYTWPHEVQNKAGTIDYVQRVYSPRQSLDPAAGKSAKRHSVPSYTWSNLNVKNTLAAWRDGRAGKMVCLPCPDKTGSDPRSFTAQMNSEEVRWVRRPKDGRQEKLWCRIGRRPNHWWDCWAMSFCVAYITGIIGEEAPIVTEEQALSA